MSAEQRSARVAAPVRHSVPDEIPVGVHLPSPSVFPMVAAAGVTLLLFGVVTSAAFMALGIVLLALAVIGWVGEVLRA